MTRSGLLASVDELAINSAPPTPSDTVDTTGSRQDDVRVILPAHPPVLTPVAAAALLAFLVQERELGNPAAG